MHIRGMCMYGQTGTEKLIRVGRGHLRFLQVNYLVDKDM